MKICIVNEFFRPYVTGDVEFFLDNFIQFLLSKGFYVKLLTCKIRGTKTYEKIDRLEIFRINSSPLKFHHFQQLPGLTFPFNVLNNFNLRIHNIIRKTDIVYINNLYHLSFAPIQIARKLNKKILLDVHDYWPICFRRDLIRPHGKLCFQNNPFTCYSCMSLTHPIFVFSNFLLFLEFYYRDRTVKNEKITIVHSKFVYDKILKYSGIQSKIIPYPYIGYKSKKPKKLVDKLRILFIGRLQPQKGVHLLPEICMKLKREGIDYEIDILGDGPLFLYLKKFSEKENLNMNFFGFIKSRLKIYSELRKSNLLLLPSIWPEPFGMVVLEAMAFGIPVIGSNRGGLKNIIEDNKVGFAIDPEVEKIVEKIKLLKENPNLYKNFSSNGIKNIKKYEPKKIFKKYLEIFEKLNL
jgi:glycosyltransferase involved in cell wall biosynthesis